MFLATDNASVPTPSGITNITLKAVRGGIEMTDLVHYKVPGGSLGNLLVPWLILPRLQGIFTYRERKLTERFASEDRLPP